MIVRLSAQRTFEAFALSQLNSFCTGFEPLRVGTIPDRPLKLRAQLPNLKIVVLWGATENIPMRPSACAILGRMKSSPPSPAVVQLVKLVCP